MKSKVIKFETIYSLVWSVFYKDQSFLSRTNYGALNVKSTLIRIYDI